jgi:hypothetical protein
MSDPEVVGVKPGIAWRAAVLACLAFAGCTVENHRECVVAPSIFGPCSWQLAAWQATIIFAFSAASMGVVLLAYFWLVGVPRSRR